MRALVALPFLALAVAVAAGPSPAAAAAGTPVKAQRASRAQTRAMEAAANAHHSGGFDSRRYHFSSAKVTDNGWGAGSWSIFPHGAQPETILFHHTRGSWHAVTWGSAVCEANQSHVPAAACRALVG